MCPSGLFVSLSVLGSLVLSVGCRCSSPGAGSSLFQDVRRGSIRRPGFVCLNGNLDPLFFTAARGLAGRGSCRKDAPRAAWLDDGLELDGRMERLVGALPKFRRLLTWMHHITRREPRKLWPDSKWTDADLEAAWLAGLQWLALRVPRADLGELSDLLQAFFIYSRSARRPTVRRLARSLFDRTVKRYVRLWREHSRISNLDEFYDAVSALYYLRRVGSVPDGMQQKMAVTMARWSERELLRSKEGPWHETAARLLDTLVDFYFLDAVGLRPPVDYKKVVRTALRWPFRLALQSNPRAFETETYLATHLVYVLSDFETKPVAGSRVAPLRRYLEGAASFYVQMGDMETLGEIVDCLKILGSSYRSPVIRRSVGALLRAQRPDGSWHDDSGDSYTRYHTTWTALSGLMEYRRLFSRGRQGGHGAR